MKNNFKYSIFQFQFKRGFTLVELLIVIAVIAGLSTMFISSYPASQKRARDAIRRSDIKQYQTSMEVYANKNGNYAVTAKVDISGTYCSTTLGLSVCPDDPKSAQNYYILATASTYRIWATLEQPSTSTYVYVCSNGKSGETTTDPTTTDPC